MKLSRQETYTITSKIYKFLREDSDKIILKKLRGSVLGTYDPDSEKITIDYREDAVATLIHELLHHWHPDWSESKVVQWEKAVVNSLSVKQFKNLMQALYNTYAHQHETANVYYLL